MKKGIMFSINILSAVIISNRSYAYGDNNSINYIAYFGNLIFFLIVFAGIILLALYLTKFIAKKTNYLGKGKNLTVLDFVNLSGNVKIVTVKIYKKVYILSITNSHTTVIDKINEEDLDRDFEDYLNQNLTNNQKDLREYIDNFKGKMLKKTKYSSKDKE